jgi:hypothetical protein
MSCGVGECARGGSWRCGTPPPTHHAPIQRGVCAAQAALLVPLLFSVTLAGPGPAHAAKTRQVRCVLGGGGGGRGGGWGSWRECNEVCVTGPLRG